MTSVPPLWMWLGKAIFWGFFFVVAALGFRSSRWGWGAFWVLLLLVSASLFDHVQHSSPQWDLVTHHSDIPDQVIEGIRGLRGETSDRIKALQYIRARGELKEAEAVQEDRTKDADGWRKVIEEATAALSSAESQTRAQIAGPLPR